LQAGPCGCGAESNRFAPDLAPLRCASPVGRLVRFEMDGLLSPAAGR
jgi:hypothetical protein